MALGVDIALVNIPDESQNNASGIASTGQSLGESMGTAIIGIILILGVFGGFSHTVDIYAPEYSDNETFQMEIFNHFEKMSNTNDVPPENIVVNSLNTIIHDSMGFVMILTILMAFVFVLTLLLNDMKVEKL